MGIPKGTKLTNHPKNNTFKVRIDDETVEQLEYLADKQKLSKSDVIRKGIEIQYKNEKNKK